MDIAALGVSIVAVGISIAAYRNTRRQTQQAEEANWLSRGLRWSADFSTKDGASELVLKYETGPPLDSATVTLLLDDDSPISGFGVGRSDGPL